MRWLEIEKDMGASDLLWVALGWGVGTAVFFVSDWVTAIFGGMLTAIVLSLLADFVVAWHIPKDARRAADKAVAAFANLYPSYKLSNVALRAIEDDRYVFSIRYDAPKEYSTPQVRRYFAVSRKLDSNAVELDERDWWPRGLK